MFFFIYSHSKLQTLKNYILESELKKIWFANLISGILPNRAKMRVLKKLYDYENDKIIGVDLVTPLLNDGLVCFVNTKDLIGWKILFYGEYEEDTNRILKEYVKPGDVVIEAGANIGSETLILSKLVGNSGMVYGFEPSPYVFDRLKINIQINELQNVKAYDVALGEDDKMITFNIFPKGYCNSGMSSKYLETSVTKKIDVKQQTLDTFIAENNINKVSFLKMDIQGAELDLIKGASKTLEKFHPIIFSEAYDDQIDTKLLYEILKSLNYTVYKLVPNGKIEFKTINDISNGNWLSIYNK